jgi:nucleoside 2-deoxyribosyltransferase
VDWSPLYLDGNLAPQELPFGKRSGTISYTNNTKVYLAGPDGFTPVLSKWHHVVLIPAVAAAGLTPVSPWGKFMDEFDAAFAMVPGPARTAVFADLDKRVGEANAKMIETSAGILAQLDGVDVDSGTASEIGYGSALGLFISGVRTDFRLSSDNEGTRVSLQVEYFITRTGGHVHGANEAAIAELAAFIL